MQASGMATETGTLAGFMFIVDQIAEYSCGMEAAWAADPRWRIAQGALNSTKAA